MRCRVIALFSVVFLAVFVALAGAGPSLAQDKKDDVKGLFLLTDYPAVTLRPGTNSTINLRLQNYNLPPERLALSVSGMPTGWTSTLIGGGQPIEAVLPATNSSVSFELRVDIPKEAPIGTTNLTVTAKGPTTEVTLPVEVKLATDLPAKLSLSPQLPELRGNSRRPLNFSSRSRTRAARK